ncbi:hypothetical protein LCGC14_3125270 [marine sediment metagenome]|uniref:Uncharacterized protein n=1 Tax=marine sediment metagenome TaxID=412755 RepID=A0A0F8YQY7_9ZZZZ
MREVKFKLTDNQHAALELDHDDVNQFMEFAVFELDADTSVAWTVSGINGAQFGIESGTV